MSVYGFPSGDHRPAVHGPRVGVPVRPMVMRQAATNSTTGVAITLPSTPLPGSILVAIAFSNQTTVGGSCTGGGVTTFNEIVRRVTGSSSGTTLNMWCGKVDTTPSATVSATTVGTNYRSRCVEFVGLSTGTIRQSASGGATANETDTAQGVTVTDPDEGGLVVAGYSSLSGTGTLPAGMTVATGGAASGRDGYILFVPTHYIADVPVAFSMFASGGRVNVALAIVD